MEEENPEDDNAKRFIPMEGIFRDPLWISVQDYETCVHAKKILKLFKMNKIVKNKDDIHLVSKYIDTVKEILFSPYNVESNFLELSPYKCVISGPNEFMVEPTHPELLTMNSKTCFRNKKIKVDDSQLGPLLDGLVNHALFTINIHEYGMIKRFHKNIIIMRHSLPEVSDILLYFPKWTGAN